MITYDEGRTFGYVAHSLGIGKKDVYRAFGGEILALRLGRIRHHEFISAAALRLHTSARRLSRLWAEAYAYSRLDAATATLVLELRKRYTVVAFTNVSRSRYLSSRRFIRGLFHRTFASCFMHAMKPQRRAYLMVLRAMRAAPRDAIFIDDTEENVIAARRLGMRALRFTSARALRAKLKSMGVI